MTDKAILAGINNYKTISDLRGCINDVKDVEKLLIDLFKFPPQNIRKLLDAEVTKERIQREWQWLLADAQPGDRLVFHCSSHGSFITDLDDDEPDGADELICLHDMDFDDPQTYLLDDELREMTSQVRPGVNLTVIFDSCHSGTATRLMLSPDAARSVTPLAKPPMVDIDSTLVRMQRAGSRAVAAGAANIGETIQRVLLPRNANESRNTVLARFVEPPPKVLEALHRKGVRGSFRGPSKERGEMAMNHVLLAGSESTQTSADAFINGDFHGAFTYHFCRVIRESGINLDQKAMIQQVRAALGHEGFSQVPQLEPENTAGPVFGGEGRTVPLGPNATPVPPAPPDRTNELLNELRLIKELLQQLPARSISGVRASGRRGLVYVHGICHHDAGFSERWWDALAPNLSAAVRSEIEPNRHEVLWSDLVDATRNPRALQLSREQHRESEKLRSALEAVLEDRARRESLPVQREGVAPVPVPARSRALLGIPGLDCIDDFLKYLLDDGIRDAVQQRFRDQLLPLLQDGQNVEVISHSWGTVVAYEALRSLDHQMFSGRVHTLFTVGSALSIGTVQDQLIPNDGQRPAIVDRWVNLDARGDIVGGPLGDASFQVDAEYLNLVPTGCGTFLGQVAPACAHSSYFNSNNTAVNADIFAAQIER